VLSHSTPHNVQRSRPLHHQYLHPKKLHLYSCGGSHISHKKCRGLSSIKLTKYTIYTNINACRVQQRYSQIIKFTQQHIIEYKSRCSSHTCILSPFLLTIFHAYHKQNFTHFTSARTSMLSLLSTPPVKLQPVGQTSHVC